MQFQPDNDFNRHRLLTTVQFVRAQEWTAGPDPYHVDERRLCHDFALEHLDSKEADADI